MKMDYDVIRQILLRIEEAPFGESVTEGTLVYDRHPPMEIAFHLDLLEEGGYIKSLNTTTLSHAYNTREKIRMTMKGYEFLNDIRSSKVWRKTKEAVDSVGSASLEVIKSIASSVILSFIDGRFSSNPS